MKSIKILVVIIIILIILLGFKMAGIEIVPEKMSEAEIRTLVEKGVSYDNLHMIELEQNGNKTEKYIKGNILVIKNFFKTEELYIWKDIDTNETISIKGNVALKQKDSEFEQYKIENFLDNSKYRLEYERKEEINGKNCIVINIIYIYDQKIIAQYAVDEETGLLMRSEIVADYTYSIGTVTDEDVEKPNLFGYKVIDYDEEIK